ncbi:hypothetical protein I7I50_05440 [Histoplasma capsulatum G186AR]|uniref:Uncharacterized protein n=1 Tax=Ajellomyces capsulatus TaxID=5037 RepID=A0A8H7Z6S3_AJECA|nr:hypothetical protein I7I52_03701 [Histoplasma capsulatum]QSS76099.1 hypothetical protein I7I50_05440 [Histoplasma capsulatum G186AR]
MRVGRRRSGGGRAECLGLYGKQKKSVKKEFSMNILEAFALSFGPMIASDSVLDTLGKWLSVIVK